MKITVIGGGSYLWAFGFIRQVVDSEKIKDITLVLFDINRYSLELVKSAGQIYNKKHGSPVKIEATMNLDSALKGSDFVVVSISTGGLTAMKHDLKIPEKYGILHTVGDTVGPGGWSRAVRNIPVFNNFGFKMKKHCPKAWLLNVSNPLTVLTRVPERNFGIKTVGLCPGVEEQVRTLAALAGADIKTARFDYTVTGIDHGSWFTKFYYDGIDVIQKLKDMGYYRSDDKLPGVITTADALAEAATYRAGFAAWRELGYLPGVGDRHSIENWPWLLTRGRIEKGKLPFGIKRTLIEERFKWRKNKEKKLEKYVKTGEVSTLEDGHGGDPIFDVIEALSGKSSFLWTSNFKNVGQISGFPDGAVLETRCLFDGAGVHPFCSPMPDILKALVLPQVLRQEAIIDITLKGSFDELVALISTDPMCSHLKIGECRKMVRELLLANRAFIKNSKLLKL